MDSGTGTTKEWIKAAITLEVDYWLMSLTRKGYNLNYQI